jgi:hypothetical protein
MQTTVESPPNTATDSGAGAPSGAASGPDEQVRDLTARLAQAESELAKAKAAADTSDLRRRIERALADTGAIDVDVACVLAENTIATTKGTIADTVAALKKAKPFLFRAPSAGPRTSAMSAVAGQGAPETLADLAQGARAGDRGSLLRYLRAKRNR